MLAFVPLFPSVYVFLCLFVCVCVLRFAGLAQWHALQMQTACVATHEECVVLLFFFFFLAAAAAARGADVVLCVCVRVCVALNRG